MIGSVDTLLGCKFLVQLEHSVHAGLSVHLIVSGGVQCNVRSIEISNLHSIEHLFKSVREVYQSEIRTYFCLVFAALVAVGTRS